MLANAIRTYRKGLKNASDAERIAPIDVDSPRGEGVTETVSANSITPRG